MTLIQALVGEIKTTKKGKQKRQFQTYTDEDEKYCWKHKEHNKYEFKPYKTTDKYGQTKFGKFCPQCYLIVMFPDKKEIITE